MTSPCGNCKNKGCGAYHDVCETYQKYKKYIDASNTNKRKYKSIQIGVTDGVNRMKTKRRSKKCVLRGDM